MKPNRTFPLLAGIAAALGAVAVPAPQPVSTSAATAPTQTQIQPATGAPASPVRQAPPPGQTMRLIAPAEFSGRGLYTIRERGVTPKEWGMSKACARMVRHGKMRALGIGGSRI